MTATTLLPFQPDAMTPAQRAAVSYLARYSGHTHALYAYQLRRWFSWCETNDLDPLIGIQRAHIELYRACAAGSRGLPGRTHRRTARATTELGQTDRPPRVLVGGPAVAP